MTYKIAPTYMETALFLRKRLAHQIFDQLTGATITSSLASAIATLRQREIRETGDIAQALWAEYLRCPESQRSAALIGIRTFYTEIANLPTDPGEVF